MQETNTAKPEAAAKGPKVISMAISSKSTLYAAYIPFLRNGGFFIPTTHVYDIGDELFLVLTLMDDPAKMMIAGKVAWVTPAGAQNSRTQGVGIHFGSDEASQKARGLILNLLGAALEASTRPTHTL